MILLLLRILYYYNIFTTDFYIGLSMILTVVSIWWFTFPVMVVGPDRRSTVVYGNVIAFWVFIAEVTIVVVTIPGQRHRMSGCPPPAVHVLPALRFVLVCFLFSLLLLGPRRAALTRILRRSQAHVLVLL